MAAPPPPARPGPFGFSPARLRLPAAHPLFEDGDVVRHLYLRDGGLSCPDEEEEEEEDAAAAPRAPAFFCHTAGCSQAFSSLESYEHHYNLLHRNVCSSCKRSFPSAHLLDVHLLEWHDSLFRVMAEKNNMRENS